MGALTITPSSNVQAQNSIEAVMAKRNFSVQAISEIGSYRIALYKKLLGNDSATSDYDGNKIYVCGTLIYRGLGVSASARAFLRDLIQGSLDQEQVLGHFIAVLISNDTIRIYTDAYALLPLYYRTDQTVVSTSFLSLASFGKDNLSVNHQAVLEILLGQGVIPPDTQLHGINRYVQGQPPKLSGIDFVSLDLTQPQEPMPRNRELALHDQISRLDHYFEQTKSALTEQGALTGLTGGFDSRLLYAMLKRHGIQPTVFTHWQNGKSDDYKISDLIARHEKVTLTCVNEHQSIPSGHNDPYLPGYLFTDGQCRSQNYWSEVYSTLDYLKKINPNSVLSLNGVGGEQFRNSEGIHVRAKNWPNWIEKHIFYRGRHLMQKEDWDLFINRHLEKVYRIINTEKKPDAITIKAYYNRIYGYANRYLRAGFECQATDHLSPFCDPYVAEYAYRSVSFLGNLYEFQKEMITLINRSLASLPSNYGFAFDKHTPLQQKISRKILQKYPRMRIIKDRYKKRYYGRHIAPATYDQLGALLGSIKWNDAEAAVNFEMHNMVMQLVYFYAQLDLV